MLRRGAGADGDRVLAAGVVTELLLEFRHPRARAEPATLEAGLHFPLFLLADERGAENEKIVVGARRLAARTGHPQTSLGLLAGC